MKDIKSYRADFEKRFNYHIGFWSSILALLCHNSLYDDAIDKIMRKDVREALMSDAQQLRKDFLKGHDLR